MNVALLYGRYFEKEASYLSEILPGQLLRLYLNVYEYEMLIERELCLYFTAFLKAALIINQAYLACRRYCQILRRFFSQQEKGMNVKLSMGIIKLNPKLPLRANIRRV